MRDSIRSFLIMLTLAAGSLLLTAPAAAWSAHLGEHAGNPVAVDEQHGHDAHGGASQADRQPAAPEKDGDSGTHDHLPSISSWLNAALQDGPSLTPPLASAALLAGRSFAALREVHPPPLARPPRTA